MARKRKEDLSVSKEVTSNFAELFQQEMDDMTDYDIADPMFCSTGSSLLDTILGGGWLSGKYHVIAAPAHSGKSTVCIQTLANFLNQYPNGMALWIDAEQATPDLRLIQLGIPYHHQKDENGNDIIDQYSGMPLPIVEKVKSKSTGEMVEKVKWDPRFFRVPVNVTVEKGFEYIDKIIQVKITTNTEKDPALVIFDSLNAMPTNKEMEVNDPDKAIGQRGKVLDFYFKKYLHKLSQYNICIIFICHLGKALNMQGPYQPYDGKMSSLKDFTIAGGKAIQFYPHNMVSFRARMGSTISEALEKMGISAGFITEATTFKAKNFSSNLLVPLVFNMLKGFDEYPTIYYNMDKDKWFDGTVSKSLPEYPDDKFNSKTFFEKLNNPEFKAKVDESWKNYLHDKYDKYHSIMKSFSTIHQDMNIDNFNAEEMANKIDEFLSMGDVGESEAHTPNTMNFNEEKTNKEVNIPNDNANDGNTVSA